MEPKAGVGGTVNLKPDWVIQQIPEQPRLQSETLSQTSKERLGCYSGLKELDVQALILELISPVSTRKALHCIKI